MTDYVDASAIPLIAEGWSDTYMHCRTLGHDFIPEDAASTTYNGHTYLRITSRCRCESERIEERTVNGRRLASFIDYAEGYLLQGQGRIIGDAKDALYMQGLHRMIKVRKQSGRKAPAPRSAATKNELGITDEAKTPKLRIVRKVS